MSIEEIAITVGVLLLAIYGVAEIVIRRYFQAKKNFHIEISKIDLMKGDE